MRRDGIVGGPKIVVLGDSYASGVAYFNSNLYDGDGINKDNCFRWKQAAAAQLETDQVDFSGQVDMQFVACSGSRLGNIAAGVDSQVGKVTGEVDLIVLSIGGNDAHFYDVASNCIFHDQSKDYGPRWPDETGACGNAIDVADGYINSDTQGPAASLDFDLRAMYNRLLTKQAYQTLPHTYHTGYILSLTCASAQTLFNSLRTRINKLTEDYNNVLKKVTADYADRKFSYLEISDRFNGHRFCEKGSNHRKQYYDDNVWLWNLSPPLSDNIVPENDPLDFPNQLQKVYDTGLWNTTSSEDRGFFPQPGPAGAGWTLRPMHPKKEGYTAIKNAIVDQMKRDGIAGVKH